MKAIGIVICFLLLTFGPSDSEGVDRTRMAKATGSNVVQSVIDRIRQSCIFPNDRLFVRRMAFVESQDGQNSSTFRPGFYGGIWQITKINYMSTKRCNGRLEIFCNKIEQIFHIDWKQTSWKDLLKPFYSGLSAYLYLAYHNVDVPGDPTQQQLTWENLFHQKLHNPGHNFSEVDLTTTARCASKFDLVFLLDESGSVGSDNFEKMKKFLVQTVRLLRIGPENIRISLVKFGSQTTIVSFLNQDNSSSEVEQRIKALSYDGAGSTNTGNGIMTVANEIFNKKNGAKDTEETPRILVLVTDGQSNGATNAIVAATEAKSKSIDIFTVGVGDGIGYEELRQMASKCNLVFTLNTFDEFDNFIYELTKGTCAAKVHVVDDGEEGSNTTRTTTKKVHVNGTADGGVVVESKNGTTIVVESKCAVVKIYGSYDNENPSESMFQITGTASDGRPIVLFVKADKDGKPLFLNFEATQVNSTEKICFNDSSFVMKIIKGEKKFGDIVCKEDGVFRNCTSVDLIKSQWQKKICPRPGDISAIDNPCTPEHLTDKSLYHPYPNDNTKFLKCDMKGRVYVIFCPQGLFYEPGRDSCGTDSTLPETKTPITTNNHPCTHENIIHNRMYFPYAADHHYYIQCDEWGGAWLVGCSGEDVWDQALLQCIPDHVGIVSPCTAEALRKGIYFFPHPNDKHKYIHCTSPEHHIIQSCGKLVYDEKIQNCLPAASGSF